jgi:hypothetical protein
VLCRDRVEDEIKSASMLSHLIGISRNDYFIYAQAKRVLLGEVVKTTTWAPSAQQTLLPYDQAETYYADLLTFGDAPMPHGRVCCNPVGGEARQDSGWKERVGQSAL